MKLTWLKFAARVSSFYTIVPCWLPEMPFKAMKEALDPQALEDAMNAMRYGPEMKARVMALAPGTYCGTFYRRKDGTMVKYKKKLVPGLKLKHVRLQ